MGDIYSYTVGREVHCMMRFGAAVLLLPVLAVETCPPVAERLSESVGLSNCLTRKSEHAPSEAGAYVIKENATEASFFPAARWGPLSLHWRLRCAPCVAGK